MENQELYEAAVEAISSVFSDDSVDRATARENLENLKDEIDAFLNALDADEAAEYDEAMSDL